MTDVRLELANPNQYESVEAYVQQHLLPVITELHRLTNELLAPGSTAEEFAVDMVPSKSTVDVFQRLDRHLASAPKHASFDGSSYFTFSKELLRSKQVKVQLSAMVYVKGGGTADFRLVRDDGMPIDNSQFECVGSAIRQVSRILPFGDFFGGISADSRTYYIEASRADVRCLPVCRRFSLSFVFI